MWNEYKKELTFAIYSEHFHFEVYSLLSIHCLLHLIHMCSVRCRFFCFCFFFIQSFIHYWCILLVRLFVRLLANSVLLYVPFVHHCQIHKHILHSLCALCSIGAALFDFYKEIKWVRRKFLLAVLTYVRLCVLWRASYYVLSFCGCRFFFRFYFIRNALIGSSSFDRMISKEIALLDFHARVSWNAYNPTYCVLICAFIWVYGVNWQKA